MQQACLEAGCNLPVPISHFNSTVGVGLVDKPIEQAQRLANCFTARVSADLELEHIKSMQRLWREIELNSFLLCVGIILFCHIHNTQLLQSSPMGNSAIKST
jgi:hypothetical protein